MSFKTLYDARQQKPNYIKRNVIRDEILGITNIPKISIAKSPLDIAVCRGMYLSPRNTDHHFVRQFGNHVIVLAQDMNKCWDRFVSVKEMMHAFFDPDSAVDNGDEFERLLEDFANPSSDTSRQMLSEYDCFWMALAAICREDQRLEFAEARLRNEISNYEIALQLKIPEQYVPRLFEPRYRKIIDRLLAS